MTADTMQPCSLRKYWAAHDSWHHSPREYWAVSSPITVLNFAANANGCKALSAAYKHAIDPLQHCGAYSSAALCSLGQCPHRSTLNSYCTLLLSHSQHLQEKFGTKLTFHKYLYTVLRTVRRHGWDGVKVIKINSLSLQRFFGYSLMFLNFLGFF